MTSDWERRSGRRVRFLGKRGPRPAEGINVSLKIKDSWGCFDRARCPIAYRLIDESLACTRLDDVDVRYEEHESGPELLLWLAGLNLASGVVQLVITVVNAWQEGKQRDDRSGERLTIIVRGMDSSQAYKEKTVLEIGSAEPLSKPLLARELDSAIQELFGDKADAT